MFNLVLEIFPAYCRKYKTIKDFKEDWNSGKDFYANHYLSNRDLNYLKENYETVYYKINNKVVYIIRFGQVQEWVNENN